MQEPRSFFVRLRYANPENALREIAKLVRNGCTDPDFLWLLADQIDPDVSKTHTGTKFELKRTTGRGGSRSVPNYALRHFLEIHLDIFNDGHKVEAVMAEAGHRFGVSLTTCKQEHSIMRAWQKRQPENFSERKRKAKSLRKSGDLEYQPLWSDVS